ncbi:hypothetical protein Sango_0103800 [Sesamum angolense]|uniref:RNase H type-1 domain-containing protein n=1 Tax=Sesamum angolense TaxID=2727404 RepID=A0AAE1XF72_9LAMI|nr:hypothetical protein Sango_0103800 [Sesamum angolense]
MESLKRKFDMHGIGVPAVGKSGGLAVFLVKSANVQLQSYSQNHIDLQLVPHTVYERLDRACANIGWSQMYLEASVSHLPQTYSDHKVLSINLLAQAEGPQSWSHPWRFEAAWLQSDQCEKVVSHSWDPRGHFTTTKRIGGSGNTGGDEMETIEPGWMALKLDVRQAYDKVEWSFLKQVMVQLGPPPPFIRSMMSCVSSVSFSFMLGVAEQEGRLQGGVCRAAPPHLPSSLCRRYIDILPGLFGEYSGDFRCIGVYRRASGQEINLSKSSVAFSRNTGADLCSRIVTDLSIRRENKMELYLGLPSKVSRSKKTLLSTIQDSIWKCILGWNAKLLSQAGREVFIKSVLQSIPTYAMSCSRLLLSLLREIQSMVANFWWNNGSQNKIHWVSWKRLCERCRWRLGSGAQVQVWMNPWLPRPHSFHPITPPTTALAHTLVSDLIDPVRRHWKAELVQQLFWLCDGSVILAIPLNRMGEQDLLMWNYSKTGSFSVCSAYHLAVSLEDSPCSSSGAALESAWWRKVWQARIPNKWFHNRCAMAGETVEPIQVATFATQFLDSFLHQAAASSSLRDTEAWATREAIQFALWRGWYHVVLEGDCRTLIQKLAAGQGDLSLTGPLIFDILCFAGCFSSCHFSWIKRSGNGVAHFLTQTATGCVEGDSNVPSSVLGLLSSDLCE